MFTFWSLCLSVTFAAIAAFVQCQMKLVMGELTLSVYFSSLCIDYGHRIWHVHLLWVLAAVSKAWNLYSSNTCLVNLLFALACQLGPCLHQALRVSQLDFRNPGIKLIDTQQSYSCGVAHGNVYQFPSLCDWLTWVIKWPSLVQILWS